MDAGEGRQELDPPLAHSQHLGAGGGREHRPKAVDAGSLGRELHRLHRAESLCQRGLVPLQQRTCQREHVDFAGLQRRDAAASPGGCVEPPSSILLPSLVPPIFAVRTLQQCKKTGLGANAGVVERALW